MISKKYILIAGLSSTVVVGGTVGVAVGVTQSQKHKESVPVIPPVVAPVVTDPKPTSSPIPTTSGPTSVPTPKTSNPVPTTSGLVTLPVSTSSSSVSSGQSWNKIVASYPVGKQGQAYHHDDIASFNGELFKVMSKDQNGNPAIPGGSDAGWYPPVGVDIKLWQKVPVNSVGEYQKISSGQPSAIATKTITASTKTAATDQVATYNPSQQSVIDPATSKNPNINVANLTQVQQVLSNIVATKSSEPIVVSQPGALTTLNLPSALDFTGQNGAATFVPLKVDAAISSKYKLALYKYDGGELIEQGDALVANAQPYNLANGDTVALLVFDKATNKLLHGAKYKVASLTVDVSSGPQLNDLGLSQKLLNNNASMEDIFKFMDSLKPGQTYTSAVASGDIKSFRIPDGAAMQKKFPTQNVPVKSGIVYSPFIDSSMAVDSKDYTPLYKYKAMTFGFAQAMINTSTKCGSIGWGGNVDISELTPVVGASGSTNSDGGKMLAFLQDLRNHNVDVSISFGGASGTPIWKFYDPVILAKVLEEFVIGTGVTRLDYDIEGGDLRDDKAMETLAVASAILQQKLKAENKDIEISLTLASEWDGLRDGQGILKRFVAKGVEIKYLNGMTMMMASDHTTGKTIAQQQAQAADSLASQIKAAYQDVGVSITDEIAHGMVGITPDIGTDTWPNEIMKPEDIQALRDMILQKKLGLFAYWNIQGTEFVHGITGMGGNQNSWTGADENKLFNVMSTILADQTNPKYDPQYHGVSAMTNAETRDSILHNLSGLYGAPSSQATSGVAAATVLSEDQARTGVLQKDALFLWTSPIDHVLHEWRTNYYAEADQRPGHAGGDTQFVDLGKAQDPAVTKALADAKALYAKAGVSLWSSGNGSGAGVSVGMLSGNDGMVDILPWNPDQSYATPGTLVLTDHGIFANKWYGDKSTTGTMDANNWVEVQVLQKSGNSYVAVKPSTATAPTSSTAPKVVQPPVSTPTTATTAAPSQTATPGMNVGQVNHSASWTAIVKTYPTEDDAKKQGVKVGDIIQSGGDLYRAVASFTAAQLEGPGWLPSTGANKALWEELPENAAGIVAYTVKP